MHRTATIGPRALMLLLLAGCHRSSGTEPPPQGWANSAPTIVERVVDRSETQLLSVRQGELVAWIEVPKVGARVGDYVLLGQGTPRLNVAIPELGEQADAIVDIAQIQVVDEVTARQTIASSIPPNAVPIGQVYAELSARAGQELVVHGTVIKATSAVGSVWVHLQDGTGDPSEATHDLTVQTDQTVARGQRAAFRGTLQKDVDLGFGYHYKALLENATLLE